MMNWTALLLLTAHFLLSAVLAWCVNGENTFWTLITVTRAVQGTDVEHTFLLVHHNPDYLQVTH